MAGRATRATVALDSAGVPHRIHTYPHDPRGEHFGTKAVDALAATLGVAPHRIFKTLIVTVDGAPATAVLPVPSQLDLKAVAAALGGRRCALAERGAAERVTGYVLGGISPLGQRARLPTLIDRPALDHATVLCSAGRRGLEMELAPADLARLTGAVDATSPAADQLR